MSFSRAWYFFSNFTLGSDFLIRTCFRLKNPKTSKNWMLPDQLCINVKRRAYDGSKYIIRNIFTYFRLYISGYIFRKTYNSKWAGKLHKFLDCIIRKLWLYIGNLEPSCNSPPLSPNTPYTSRNTPFWAKMWFGVAIWSSRCVNIIIFVWMQR